MKRYILLAWEDYYECGGLNDIVGSFDTIQEAVDVYNTKTTWNHYQLVERDTWKILEEN
jgi:hypothetical protein